jgi:hypothetical protein
MWLLMEFELADTCRSQAIPQCVAGAIAMSDAETVISEHLGATVRIRLPTEEDWGASQGTVQ